jgi:hypothetical protein
MRRRYECHAPATGERRRREVITILSKDEALLISKRKAARDCYESSGWAKLLRVDVPPRQVVVPSRLHRKGPRNMPMGTTIALPVLRSENRVTDL